VESRTESSGVGGQIESSDIENQAEFAWVEGWPMPKVESSRYVSKV